MAKKSPFETQIFRKEEVQSAKSWFRDRLKELQKQSLKNVKMSDLRQRGKQSPFEGSMHTFLYKAKGDGKLPYWDRFPLVIAINQTSTHFMGLNLHYLNPQIRQRFLLNLMNIINNDNFNSTTKFRMTYDILQSAAKYRYFKPCIKQYIKQNVRSKINTIRPEQWHKAISLPTADFKGASVSEVWNDSRGRY
jgi:hypothetical protein